MLNPIVDWTDAEVWEFIHEYGAPYCELYDKGFKRLGCVGCPISANSKEFEAYPKYKNLYLLAFKKMLDVRRENNLPIPEHWKTEDKVMNWWLQETDKELTETEITALLG